MKHAPTPATAPQASAFPIVGIGASAGGREALEAFLKNVPANSGMAFVIVQHLDPTHKGMMAELLQRATGMQVVQVKDRTKVRPDWVYVLPPNKDMSILHGVLHLLDPVAPRGLRLPIDFFFRALALDRRDHSIGVILSGMGSDGTLGLRAIKEQAGVVFVQDPGSAKFDGMPRSAVDAGLADVVAPAEALPGRIVSYLHHVPLDVPRGLAEDDQGHSGFEKVVILLRAQTGHDFFLYKKSTVYRRIARRMSIHQIERIATYVRFLQTNRQELDLLFEELLIGVTSFFRDPAAVLVNKEGDIVFVSGHTGKYLEPAAGKANWNILAMAREGLRYELAGAFQKALRGRDAVTRKNVRVGTDGGVQSVDLTVQALVEPEGLRGLVMVVFTDVATPLQPEAPPKRAPAGGPRAAALERDLAQTRQEMQTIREEMQTSQEEARSAQEELQSANEELLAARTDLEASRARYLDLYDFAPVGYCTLSAQGVILEANLTVTTLLVMARGALVRQPIVRFILKDDQDIYHLHRNQLFETGKPQECELRMVKPDGAFFWAHLAATAAQAENGAQVCRVALMDITARRRAEEATRESEARYRGLFANSRDAIMTLAPPSWAFTSGNPAALEMFGAKTEAEFTAHEPWKLSPELQPDGRASAEKAREMIATAMRDGSHFFEWTHRRISGEAFPADVLLSRLSSAGTTLLQATVRDITARKQAEAVLAESEARFRTLYDTAADGLFVMATNTERFVLANKACLGMLGYTQEEFAALRLDDLHPTEDLPFIRKEITKFSKGEIAPSADVRFKRKDGNLILVEVHPNAVRFDGQVHALVAIRDVTERRRMEEELTQSHEALRGLLNRLETAREEERTRIARDIHDDLGQNLTAIKMDLRWIERALEKAEASPELDAVKARAVSAIEIADATTATVQELATQLRPGVLDKLGLGPAIRFEARRFHAHSGINCRVSVPDALLSPAPAVATALFRILQECLTNAARHSGATRTSVRLGVQGDDFFLRVHDNGKGIPDAALDCPQSLGLLGMKERAAMLGGDVDFRPNHKSGTVVTVRIPNAAIIGDQHPVISERRDYEQ